MPIRHTEGWQFLNGAPAFLRLFGRFYYEMDGEVVTCSAKRLGVSVVI